MVVTENTEIPPTPGRTMEAQISVKCELLLIARSSITIM